MAEEDPARVLALILAGFSPQARGRLARVLPGALRDRVDVLAERVAGLAPGEMSVLEQVLAPQVAALASGEEEEAEAYPLRVGDVVALLLRHATPPDAAGILMSLPPPVQGPALLQTAAWDWERLERRLGRGEGMFLRMLEAAWEAPAKAGGPGFAAAILERLRNPGAVRRLLTGMYRQDPETTGEVQDLLYGFEELVRLTDPELQTVLTGVDHRDLALVLRTASSGLRRRVLANLSERRAAYLEEDEAVLDEVDSARAAAVQHEIVERTRRLYEAGRLHTYFGSVAREEEEPGVPEEEPVEAPVARQAATPPDAPEERRSFRGAILALIGAALAVFVIVWVGERASDSRRTATGTGRAAGVGDSEVQRDRPAGQRGVGRQGGGGSLSDFALVVGNVRVVSETGERPAEDAALRAGDAVMTDEDGRAVFRLGDEAGRVAMEPSSSVEVGEDGAEAAQPPRLTLRLGRVWVYVKNPELEVRTPVARVTASEGAVFRARIVLDATTTFSVHRGTLWVEPLGRAGQEQVVLGPGEEVEIAASGRLARQMHDLQPEGFGADFSGAGGGM